MERVIGYLGSLLQQPSNPFRNLAAQMRRMAHNNALFAMWPDLERTKGNPMGSMDVGNGYLLLAPRDTSRYDPLPVEQAAIEEFLASYPGIDRND